MVIKTIKAATENEKIEIMSLYKDKEDEQDFIKQLLRKTVSMDSENLALIDDLTKNWELDRIAKMDILLLKMAITELQIFKNIPKKVTLNEYIEISKFYSTPKSHGFINGILDNAIDRLEKDGKMGKMGRGLMND
jgi:N utilization substance protein B